MTTDVAGSQRSLRRLPKHSIVLPLYLAKEPSMFMSNKRYWGAPSVTKTETSLPEGNRKRYWNEFSDGMRRGDPDLTDAVAFRDATRILKPSQAVIDAIAAASPHAPRADEPDTGPDDRDYRHGKYDQ